MSKIGAHVSAAKGVFNAPINAVAEGLETFQMFSRPPQSFNCPPLPPADVKQFLANVKQAGFKNYYIHAPYLINLASANNRLRHGSITMLKQELERGTQLGVTGVMFHTGSSASQPDRASAVVAAKKSLNAILEGYTGTCKLLIENAAGTSAMGSTIAEVGDLLDSIKQFKNKIGVCIDTQHAFGSGIDWRTKKDVDNFVVDFDKKVGLKNLVLFQINDSKVPFDSHKDRHEHIGQGELGEKAFGYLLNHPKLKHLDFVLETPFEGRDKDLAILRRLRKA